MEEERIIFISKSGQIEESAGKRKFYMIADEKIMEYEKRMLCDSGCRYTLPMYFISEEGAEKVYYDFTGFVQLEEHIKRKISSRISVRDNQNLIFDALDKLSGILECLKGMESYLFFPERISTNLDTIFINLNDGRAAFAFYPNEKPGLTLQSRIISMVEEINGLYRDGEVEQYLNKFKDFIYMKNPGLDGMISILGTIQREVSCIYCNSADFRRNEEGELLSEYEKNGWNHKETNDTNGRNQADKHFSAIFKRPGPLKPIAIQAIIGAGLAAVYMSGVMETMDFAGVAVITVGADLWIMRRLHYI